MRRSWAYVLMIVATLVGGSALLWPLPPTVRIEEMALPAAKPVASPRPEISPARNRAAAKAAAGAAPPGAAAKQEAPALVKRFPTQNTSLQRLAPPPRPGADAGGTPMLPAAPRPGAALPTRPPTENRQ